VLTHTNEQNRHCGIPSPSISTITHDWPPIFLLVFLLQLDLFRNLPAEQRYLHITPFPNSLSLLSLHSLLELPLKMDFFRFETLLPGRCMRARRLLCFVVSRRSFCTCYIVLSGVDVFDITPSSDSLWQSGCISNSGLFRATRVGGRNRPL
jgi:hypothetical protein